MAGFGVSAFLLTVAISPYGSIAAVLSGEKDSVVRREPQRVQLGSYGELLQAGDKPGAIVAVEEPLSQSEKTEAEVATQYCDDDFPMGVDGANTCPGGSGQPGTNLENIQGRAMCEEAGIQAGANGSHPGFVVLEGTTDRWEYKHPRGCYKDSCGVFASDPVCYYWNGIGGTPNAQVVGQSVCTRKKHTNGSTDAYDGCPPTYQVVDDEYTCRQSAECLFGEGGAGTDFRIGNTNASKHLDHPRGCFWIIEGGTHKVYYNPPSLMGVGSVVKGTNICNVTSSTSWVGATASTSATGWSTNASLEQN